MLGSGQSSWRRMPFSYRKLCDIAAAWLLLGLFLGMMLLSAVGPLRGFFRGGLAFCLGLGTILCLVALFQRFALMVLWKRLSSEFRERIPFDTAEAMAGKGTIRSLRDCWHWVRHG